MNNIFNMEDNNEEKINDNNYNIINNENNNNNEFLEEKLYKILKESENRFNEKKTKIKLKTDYEYIIQIINKLDGYEFINFVNYLNKVKIQILKILVNGYIEFDFNDKKYNEIILNIISKIIFNYFNRNIFNFIYKKLSKQFRNHHLLTDTESIIKFEKLFEIWKLLYNIKREYPYKNVDNPSLNFITNENKKSQNIKINLEKYINKYSSSNIHYRIYISFFSSPISNLNKYVSKFYFLKFKNNSNDIFEFKYNDIFNENNKCTFSKVNIIAFNLNNSSYNISINDVKLIEKKTKFNFSFISEIKILNYFYGEISSIIIKKEDLTNNKNNFVILIENKSNKMECKIILGNSEIQNKQKEKDLIQINGSFNDNPFDNNKAWIKEKKYLNEIEYFGGFKCFIPLFKILKYIINNLGNKDNFTQNNINYFVKKAIIWSKDILKIILKLICLSEDNYNNFKKIIISLVGSLAEISHSLNKLFDSKLITDEYKSSLYKDEVIYTLFIIIINSEVPNNILNAYNKIFGIYDNWNNIKLLMDNMIININNNKFIDLYWYSSILLNIIIFILLYFDSYEIIPKNLIEQIKKIYIYINEKKGEGNKKQKYIIAIKPFISFINIFFEDNIENWSDKFKEIIKKINIMNENNYYYTYIINIIKIILKIKELAKINSIKYKEDSFLNTFIALLIENNYEYNNKLELFKNIENKIKNIFKNHINGFGTLQAIFPFLLNEEMVPKNELLMNELIDYHGIYHSLIKKLFIFHRLWSNKKMFINRTFETRNQSKLKYKNINYYTRNFQRPIIYPILDYKYHYPEFSDFHKQFYYIEDKDDYNFDLDCPELDKIIDEYNKTIIEEINKNDEIKKYNICLIKQMYHVKGHLYIINTKDESIIYYYSYPYDIKNNTKKLSSCNNYKENAQNILCYGSIFKSHIKEKYKKIKIKLSNIRMILKKIYYIGNQA